MKINFHKFFLLFLVFCFSLTANATENKRGQTLSEAKKEHKTKLIKKEKIGFPVPAPPSPLEIVEYQSPLGKFPAYLTKPKDLSKKYPAIIWIVGGFSNSISESAWSKYPKNNDQSAQVFREKGIVTLYPSLRGGNQNSGYLESFYGEVDDIIAAAQFLQKIEYVDPKKIYLGGHSTGGTLALLVAESADLFRAIFAFGPVEDVSTYGQDYVAFDVKSSKERTFRSPIKWLHSIKNPTFIFEGSDGNIDSLYLMKKRTKNPLISFYPLKGYDHFNIIHPVSNLIAEKILSDKDSSPSISFSKKEILHALKKD